MKKQFSFTRLLKHDKLMMLVSLILAIVLWFVVVSGPANIQERPISVTVTVDLTNTYAHQSGLRVLGNNTFEAKVTVSGTWSVISKLNADDIRVRPDLSSITGAGDVKVPLTVARNSEETDYDILSVSPRTVTVMCDYWQEGSFKVQTDVSALTATDSSKFQIGEPFLDTSSFSNGKLTVEGPKSVVSQIRTLTARIDSEEALSEMKQYTVPIVALDEEGKELDLSFCSFKELPTGTVTMTVPIWEQRHIDIGYTVKNLPAGMVAEELLNVEPAALDVLGPSADLDELEARLKNIGMIDFHALSTEKNSVKFDLTIPATVRATDVPQEIAVSLNTENLAQKSFTLTPSAKNVVYKGDTKAFKSLKPQQSPVTVTLVGDSSAISAITSAALMLEIDLGGSPKVGMNQQFIAKVLVNGYDDIWAYYGEETDGVKVIVTLT